MKVTFQYEFVTELVINAAVILERDIQSAVKVREKDH